MKLFFLFLNLILIHFIIVLFIIIGIHIKLFFPTLPHLLFMAVEILEILVIVEGHVSDGVALALLVGGVHDRVGGVREVHQVAAVLQRFHYLQTNR